MQKDDIRRTLREGQVFLINPSENIHVVALIARTRRGKIGVLAYIFDRYITRPEMELAEAAIKVSQTLDITDVSALGFSLGNWIILGNYGAWNRADWPVPLFRSRSGWYSRRDDKNYEKEIEVFRDPPTLQSDVRLHAVYGYIALEDLIRQEIKQGRITAYLD